MTGVNVLDMADSSWWLNQPNLEKYSSNWIMSPGKGENKKKLKPPHSLLSFIPRCETKRSRCSYGKKHRSYRVPCCNESDEKSSSLERSWRKGEWQHNVFLGWFFCQDNDYHHGNLRVPKKYGPNKVYLRGLWKLCKECGPSRERSHIPPSRKNKIIIDSRLP